jgi:hypothetical protein
MFTIESVNNLQWCNIEHTFFICDVKYLEFNEIHPTGVNAIDPYAHIQELWVKGNAGVYGEIAEYVTPKISIAEQPQPQTSGTQTI